MLKKVLLTALAVFSFFFVNGQVVFFEKLELLVEIVKTSPVGGGIKRTRANPPSVWKNENTLYFEINHPAYTIELVGDDDEVYYSAIVSSSEESITIPQTLSGNFELRIYNGSNYYFYCDVFL